MLQIAVRFNFKTITSADRPMAAVQNGDVESYTENSLNLEGLSDVLD